MFTLRDILLGVALPALISAAIVVIGCVVAWSRARRAGDASAAEALAGNGSMRDDCCGPLAVGVGFAAGFAALLGLPPVPPVDSTDWLFGLSILLTVSGIVDSWWRLPSWGRWINFLFDAALAVALLAWPIVRNSENPTYEIGILSAVVVALVVSWIGIERIAGTERGWPAVEVCCATGLVAITLMTSGSKKLGQVGGLLAAAIAPFAVVALVSRKNALGRGTIPLVMLLVAGLLLCGKSFASLTTLNVALLWTGLVASQVRRLPPVNRLSEWKQCAIGLAAVLVFAGTAAALAAIEFARSMSDYGY